MKSSKDKTVEINSAAPKTEPNGTKSNSSTTAFLLKLFTAAQETKATHVELCRVSDSAFELRLTTDGSSKSFQIKGKEAHWIQIVEALSSCSHYWPDPGDTLFLSNSGSVSRLFLSPESGFNMFSDLVITHGKELANQKIVLSNVQWNNESSLFDYFQFSDVNRGYLQAAHTKQRGIVLADRAMEPHAIDGCAIFHALRPDAFFVSNIGDAKSLKQALDLSEKCVVLIGDVAEDPVEMIFDVAAQLSQEKDLVRRFYRRLLLSFVHKRLRRVCRQCSRPASSKAELVEELPEVLRPDETQTHVLGLGCDNCMQTGFHGTVGIESVVSIDNVLRELLLKGQSAANITEMAYRSGARSLLEDSLAKLYAGETSLESVLQTVTKITPGFLGAVISRSDNQEEAPKDIEVRETLQSFEDDFFVLDDDAMLALARRDAAREATATAEKPVRRLLLVEDDDDQRHVLQMVFENGGFQVVDARDGKDALDKLQSETVDIIVSDLMMPVMNGKELVQNIRDSANLRHLPVLMLTAVDSENAEYSLLSAGADDFCSKRSQRKIIVKRVERLLSRSTNPLAHK